MTTLQSYLSSGAVEDVRKLLKQQPWTDEGDRSWSDPLIDDGIAWDDMVSPGVVWREIVLCFADEPSLTCYYREQSGSYIVSDCGETVSEVMRRTGKTWREALAFVHRIEVECVLAGDRDADIRCDGAEDLAQAIVTVLAIVAKVRAGLDKEQG